MGKIVTIGGGDITRKGTLVIDKEIIRLSGKKKPRLLFIPTASSDSVLYSENIKKYFGDFLGCKVEVLFLIKENPTKEEIKKKILKADIIYVGGGNTLKMMNLWRKLGVDKVLKAAYEKNTVLCGVSAGSICWYEYGHSDSMSFYNKNKWKYIKVKGLGFLKGIHCPHYDSKTFAIPRRKEFQNMIKKEGGIGIAIEDNCAIEYIGDKYRVLSSKPKAKAFRLHKNSGEVISIKIEQKKDLATTTDLLKK